MARDCQPAGTGAAPWRETPLRALDFVTLGTLDKDLIAAAMGDDGLGDALVDPASIVCSACVTASSRS